MNYKRISPITVEIDGEYYNLSYNNLDAVLTFNGPIFDKIKTLKDALVLDLYEHTYDIGRQINAFTKLSTLANVINEGKINDENGLTHTVIHVSGILVVRSEKYASINPISFASKKLALYSIEIAEDEWLYYYGLKK